MSGYIYSTLPVQRGTQQIRLLKTSRSSSGQIDCELHVFALDDQSCPKFTAASYVWGPSSPRRQITLNGYAHSITLNLYDVLHSWTSCTDFSTNDQFPSVWGNNFISYFCHQSQMPWSRPTSWLWIDALCIDQSNNSERSQQVSIMSSIYSKAECVVAWLGPNQWSRSLVDLLGKVEPAGSNYAPSLQVEQLLRFARWDELDSYEKSTMVDEARRLEATKAPWNQELNNLLNHKYWTRAWIVQEVTLAKHLIITDGKNFRPWDRLQAATVLTQGTENTAGYRLLVEKRRGQTRNPPLNEQLIRWHQQECNDWHDKVYAFVGISECQRIPAPDYNCSKEQLFSTVVATIDWKFDGSSAGEGASISLARIYNTPPDIDASTITGPMNHMGGARSPWTFCQFLARFTTSLGLQPNQSFIQQIFIRAYYQASKDSFELTATGIVNPRTGRSWTYEAALADKRTFPELDKSDDCWWLFLQFCSQIRSR